jgi:hypothetical protein
MTPDDQGRYRKRFRLRGAQLIRVGPARKDAVTVDLACSGADRN